MKSGEVTPAVFTDYSKAFASTDFDINVSCRILSFLLIFRIVAQIFSSNLSCILETGPYGFNVRFESKDKTTEITKLQDLLESSQDINYLFVTWKSKVLSL